jgi:hypothetical protein
VTPAKASDSRMLDFEMPCPRNDAVLEGEVEIAGETFEGPRLLVFHPRGRIAVRPTRPARLMFLGGPHWRGHATSGGISCPRAGNGSSKPKKIGRREDSRRCRAKQSSFRFPNPR